MKKALQILAALLLTTAFIFAREKDDNKKDNKSPIKNSVNGIDAPQAVEGDVIFSDGTNQLIRITDEGTSGAIQFSDGVPTNVTNKLYNDAGILYFNGDSLSYGSITLDSLNDLSDASYDGESLFIGADAGTNDDSGASDGNKNYNLGIGKGSLTTNVSGDKNVAIGNESQYFNVTGSRNTSLGATSMYNNFSGNANVALGFQSNYFNETGERNTLVGNRSGYGSTGISFSDNIFIGYQAGYNETTSNKLYIENTDSDTPLIWGDFVADQVRVNGSLEATTKILTPKIKLTTGATEGYVLTSDIDGNATWQDNANPKIGFSAYFTSSETFKFQDIGTDQVELFTETLDDGNTFNPTSGIFTAPSDGFYHFDLNFNWGESSLSPSYTTYIYIKNNGVSFPGSNVRNRHEFEETTYSNQLFSFNLYLSSNDEITIFVDAEDDAAIGAPPGLGSGGILEGGNNGNSSTFSGYKIY